MRTDELIAVLAADAVPVAPQRAGRRLLACMVAGVLLAAVLMAWLLGPRPDLADALRLPMFWVKLALPAAVLAGACLLLQRVGYPGRRAGPAWLGTLLPLVLMSAAGALVLASAPVAERPALLYGGTWRDCIVNVPLLSLPALVLATWALRGLAPTRLRLAGAAAGLFAGAAAALAYALHCPELEAPFLGTWYVAGMLLPAVLGAITGRFALRW